MATLTALSSLLDSLCDCLDDESARRLIAFKIAPPVQDRVNELVKKAKEGLLTDAERSEHETLIDVADIISILRLKAHQRLQPNIK